MDGQASFDQHAANGLIAPVIAGALIQNMLFGVLLMIFFNHVGTSRWARASGAMKGVLVVVMLLTAGTTALYTRDIFFYALTFAPEMRPLVLGTLSEAYEPVLVGLLAAVVQQALVLRAARLMGRGWVRSAYLVAMGVCSTLSLASAVGVAICAQAYAKGAVTYYLGGVLLTYQTCFEAWMFTSGITDAAISLSYIILIRRTRREWGQPSIGALRTFSQYTLQSASYVTVAVLVSGVLTASLDPLNPAVYDMNYLTWMPCSVLYAFALFTALNVPSKAIDRLPGGGGGGGARDKACDLGAAEMAFAAAPAEEDGFTAFAPRRSREFRRSSSPHRRAALEGMVTKPGEPAWEQRSTSFLGVKIPLQLHDEPELLDGRPSFQRATSEL